MSDSENTFDSRILDGLLKAVREKGYVAKVGILGTKNSRQDDDEKSKDFETNSVIGARHEFGTSKIPKRSFLVMPLQEKLGKEIQKAGGLDENTIKDVVKNRTFKNWLEKVAILGVSVVLEAFNTGGFGTWQPLSPKTLKKKKVKQILVETHQLRDSITYRIDSK